MNKQKNRYYIYGRTEYEKPLTFIKEIEVEASIHTETLEKAGNQAWIELISIPANALIHVIGQKTDD